MCIQITAIYRKNESAISHTLRPQCPFNYYCFIKQDLFRRVFLCWLPMMALKKAETCGFLDDK
jgi:hypothetical protein